MSAASELFDAIPSMCPACGKSTVPRPPGQAGYPSWMGWDAGLSIMWQPILGTYLCSACNSAWANWESQVWASAQEKAEKMPPHFRDLFARLEKERG